MSKTWRGEQRQKNRHKIKNRGQRKQSKTDRYEESDNYKYETRKFR